MSATNAMICVLDREWGINDALMSALSPWLLCCVEPCLHSKGHWHRSICCFTCTSPRIWTILPKFPTNKYRGNFGRTLNRQQCHQAHMKLKILSPVRSGGGKRRDWNARNQYHRKQSMMYQLRKRCIRWSEARVDAINARCTVNVIVLYGKCEWFIHCKDH